MPSFHPISHAAPPPRTPLPSPDATNAPQCNTRAMPPHPRPHAHTPMGPYVLALIPRNPRNTPPLPLILHQTERSHRISSSKSKNLPSASPTAIPLPDPLTFFDGT